MLPKLKSLELHGYKTFAIRTGFEFPGMITAIVGPNGSGKSNIADAMRWVLGEQSYSLLRGKKTEDMIFAGSEQRPRAGMASATIVFDNADGWLPIDYTEVSITRRAYRDGQNEYLLNGQRVRLREISELLAQSGLAERTYTIIGQGLVDAALALKPEERRRLFEEAAGIGLYRSRKEEAVNRLEATRRNLERVQDILAELEPRLQSLEKQARRVQEYERIKADLRLLLRDWYGYHWHRAQQELKRTREVMRQQENRLEAARQHQEELTRQATEMRGQIQARRTQLNVWHVQSAELHTMLERIRRDLAILEERERSQTEQRLALHTDLARQEEELQSLQQTLVLASQERDRLLSELQEAESQSTMFRQQLTTRQAERSQIEGQLREARQKLRGQENRLVQLKAHQDELVGRVETQQGALQGALKALEASQQEIQKVQQGLEAAATVRQSADADRQKVEETLQNLRQKIQDTEAQRKHQVDELSRLETEQARQRALLDVIGQAEASLSGYAEGARALLTAARQGRLTGLFGPLGSRVEVPAELETAITAALGEYLDLVLLDSSADPDRILSFLEKGVDPKSGQVQGRVALLPVEWIAPDELSPLPADPDCLGRASDLIHYDESLRPAVSLLLGQVLVVTNRAAARRILDGFSTSIRAVTLRGEVFYAAGPVVAGASGRSGLIGRQRQKRELQDGLKEIESSIEVAQPTLESIEQGLLELRAREKDLLPTLRQATLKVETAHGAYQQAAMTVEGARRQHDWQMSQRSSLEGQISQTQKEIGQVKAESAAAEGKAEDAQTQVQELVAALNVLPLEELQAQAAHWNTAAAVTARAVKDAEKRVGERQLAVERNQNTQQGLQSRLDELTSGIERLAGEKSSFRQQEKEVAGQIDTLQTTINPAEQELSDAEKEYDELQVIETAAQQALTLAERHATQAQADLARQRDSLENLRRRVEEDFGLVAFEYAATVSGPTPLPFDGMVEQLPDIAELPPGLEDNLARQRAQLRRLGAINPDALSEYNSVKERFHFMTTQVSDLRKADGDLRQVITELDELMKRDFRKTFNAVASEFKVMFSRLFAGGTARLVLVDEENLNETGIDIEARLPGRREQGLSLLSGGERSLTAAALVFALLKVSPTPFCVMDEVDAMLDESNVGRFCELLRELSQATQFIVITHNRNTVQAANVIYGVTLGRDSVSQVISLKFDEISVELAQ